MNKLKRKRKMEHRKANHMAASERFILVFVDGKMGLSFPIPFYVSERTARIIKRQYNVLLEYDSEEDLRQANLEWSAVYFSELARIQAARTPEGDFDGDILPGECCGTCGYVVKESPSGSGMCLCTGYW